MKTRPMIGDVPAARIVAPGTERPILEIKTNGKCQVMTPDVQLAHDTLCANFEVPPSKRRIILEGIKAGQLEPDFVHQLVTKQLTF
jgi:hypothetical protein